MTLVDTNVLLDLATNDETWADWSVAQLEEANLRGPLLINDVIYAELSVRYERIEDLEALIDAAGLELRPLPRSALFLRETSSPVTADPGERARVCSPTSSSVHMPL